MSGIQTLALQRVPTLRAFWDLEKTVLHEIPVSGTVVTHWSATVMNPLRNIVSWMLSKDL